MKYISCLITLVLFLARLLWAIAAQLLTLFLVIAGSMFVCFQIAGAIVKDFMVTPVGLLGWFALIAFVARVLPTDSKAVAAAKRIHRRFVFPFGEV